VYTKSRNVWEMVRARGRNLLCSKIHWLQSDSAGEHDVYFFYFYPIASNIFFPRGPGRRDARTTMGSHHTRAKPPTGAAAPVHPARGVLRNWWTERASGDCSYFVLVNGDQERLPF